MRDCKSVLSWVRFLPLPPRCNATNQRVRERERERERERGKSALKKFFTFPPRFSAATLFFLATFGATTDPSCERENFLHCPSSTQGGKIGKKFRPRAQAAQCANHAIKKLHFLGGGNAPDAVEDVDEDEEEGDEERHPAGHHLRLDEEGHPRHHHEHARREVHLQEGDEDDNIESGLYKMKILDILLRSN